MTEETTKQDQTEEVLASPDNRARLQRILLGLISLVGLGVTGYLAKLYYTPATGEAVCNLGAGLSCEEVSKSIYAEIIGIPMGVLGLAFFLAVLVVALWLFNEKFLKLAIFASILSLGPSLYLTAMEIFVIENICVFCELSKVLMIGVILVTLWSIGWNKYRAKHWAAAILLALLLAGITYLYHAISLAQV
ncbi:vitamin K epoxide reductase family protein [Patescibacteria group bacterium]